MRSEPGHDQPAAGPAAAQPGASRAGQVAVVTFSFPFADTAGITAVGQAF